MALEQGREVFAVPGSPLDPRARGCNHLLRQGAILTESADDVIEGLEAMLKRPIEEPERPPFEAGEPIVPADSALESARPEIEELLSPSPVAVDELIRRCQVSPAIVNLVLLEFELAGRIERHPGNRVSLLPEAPLEAASI